MSKTIKYKLGRYEVHINIWYLILFLLIQTLLNELGFWQLSRAQEKQYRLIQLEKGAESVQSDLSAISAEDIEQFQAVKLPLQRFGYWTIYLDNKIDQKRPGYHVLNIAQDPKSGDYLLINRGWVFAGLERDKLPTVELPAENWLIEGRVYQPIIEAITVGQLAIETKGDSIRIPVLDQAVMGEVEKQLNIKLKPYLIRLNEKSQSALKTNWLWTNMSPEKHLAYAIQWFALALAFLVVSLVVSIKRKPIKH